MPGNERPGADVRGRHGRHILDTSGLNDVEVVETEGMLTDHYDPSHRVVRLSQDVYHGQTAASVGIAAHEVGHALQHASVLDRS
ncbi:MAG: zinc metallopeptidase [Planctomycetaceae bacterium]